MTINCKNRIIIELSNQWLQFFDDYHWYTFNLINLEFEYEEFTDGYTFDASLLGFSIHVRYNTKRSKQIFDKWTQEVEEGIEEWQDAP